MYASMYTQMRRVRRFALCIVAALFLIAPNLASISAATVTYEQRSVKKATYSDGTIVDYSYDANGNRTANLVTPVPPDTTPPSVPGNADVQQLAGTSATATWTAATDNVAVAGYDYRLNAGSWQSLRQRSHHQPCQSRLSRELHLQRASSAMLRAISGPRAPETSRHPMTSRPPYRPIWVLRSPASNTVNLSWTASTDNVAVTGYRIFRGGGQIGTERRRVTPITP